MPTPYRYTHPVPKNAATGQVAAVYAQVVEEFILADGPLMSLSPVPDLLAATWALLREAQLAGQVPRVNKEAVAAAVSFANACQFCVDAHTSLIHAAGEHTLAEAIWRGKTPQNPDQAALVAWAKATASDGPANLASPPFPASQAAEYIGTALVTHFINRMVSSLLNENLLPSRVLESQLVRRVVGRVLGRTVRLHPNPGTSLPLLSSIERMPEPMWAESTSIGDAYAALRAVATRGGALLSLPARQHVQSTVTRWDGTQPRLERDWLESTLTAVPDADLPGTRLALLAALAPHQVSDAEVAAWRATHPADDALIALVAFGAMTAVDRIEAWATVAWRPAAMGQTGVAGRFREVGAGTPAQAGLRATAS